MENKEVESETIQPAQKETEESIDIEETSVDTDSEEIIGFSEKSGDTVEIVLKNYSPEKPGGLEDTPEDKAEPEPQMELEETPSPETEVKIEKIELELPERPDPESLK
ncbi:MAG: hypothetical protein ACLFQV_06310 [Vulcanimicrobiota bacterium]